MSTDISNWTNLDPDDDDSAGKGYSRLSLLFRSDPFVQMLSKDAIEGLLAAIFSPEGHGVAYGDRLRAHFPEDVVTDVLRVFSMSPLAIVNDKFKDHVAGLTVRALFPQPISHTD